MEERIQLTNGYRWWRWLFVPIALIAFVGLLYWENVINNIIGLVICTVLFYLLNRARTIYFDSTNLYLVYGKEEKIVPLRAVKSLKRSAAKVNGSRYWILIYEGDGSQEKKFRFFCGPFGSTIKKFISALKSQNSNVVVWTHPHFNH